MRRRSVLGVLIAFGSSGAVVAACGVDASSIDAPDGGIDGATSVDEASVGDEGSTPPPADAGADGEVITDGGGNVDPDAGDEADAAVCNAVANDAPAIMSTCASLAPALGGGALVAGTYHLTDVVALAPAAFCQNAFQPVSFKQTIALTVGGDGVGTANVASQVAAQPTRTRTSTLDPGANDSSPMVATPTCPPASGGPVEYFSGLRNQKQVIVMRLAYGQAQALYRFEKQ